MNLTYLETFLAVAKHKSFSRAAKAQNLTQPAVSKHIALLEAHFNAQLIHRTSRQAELTEAGLVLYDTARHVLASLEKAQEEISSFTEEVKGRLLIGASTIPGHYLLPGLIGAFKLKYPLVRVSLEISNTGRVINRLREGDLHLGVVGAPVRATELICTAIAEDELVLIVPVNHVLATCSEVAAADILGKELILREKGSGTRRIIEEKLAGAGICQENIQSGGEFGSTEAVLGAVEAGMGISFVSRWAAERAAQAGKVKFHTLKDLSLSRSLYLVYPRDRSLSRPTQAFLVFVNA